MMPFQCGSIEYHLTACAGHQSTGSGSILADLGTGMGLADVIGDIGQRIAVGTDWTLYGGHLYFGEHGEQVDGLPT